MVWGLVRESGGLLFIRIGECRAFRRTIMNTDQRVFRAALCDESAADRIPHLFVQQIAFPVECLESHTVGMRGETLPLFEDDVTVWIENDAPAAGQIKTPAASAFLTGVEQMRGVDRIGHAAFKPGDDCAVSSVAEAGQGQRTVQDRPDAGDLVQDSRTTQRTGESACGLHRADRVR